jgi:hypothetical protein
LSNVPELFLTALGAASVVVADKEKIHGPNGFIDANVRYRQVVATAKLSLERPAGFAYAAGCNDLPSKSFSI